MSDKIYIQENKRTAIALLDKQREEVKSALSYYLSVIINAIDNCGGLIHEGNYNLFTRTDNVTGKRIVYFCHSWSTYDQKKCTGLPLDAAYSCSVESSTTIRLSIVFIKSLIFMVADTRSDERSYT